MNRVICNKAKECPIDEYNIVCGHKYWHEKDDQIKCDGNEDCHIGGKVITSVCVPVEATDE
jgi:hypothetical protein